MAQGAPGTGGTRPFLPNGTSPPSLCSEGKEDMKKRDNKEPKDLGSNETRITCPALSSAASFVFAQPGSFPTENLDIDVSYFCAFQ